MILSYYDDLYNDIYKKLDSDGADEEEFDKPLTDESLNEADSIKVTTKNFRPNGEDATETYRIIREAGKLGSLQDLLDNMYPDVDQVDANEVNTLLADRRDWVFNMLDIHEEEKEI